MLLVNVCLAYYLGRVFVRLPPVSRYNLNVTSGGIPCCSAIPGKVDPGRYSRHWRARRVQRTSPTGIIYGNSSSTLDEAEIISCPRSDGTGITNIGQGAFRRCAPADNASLAGSAQHL
jgi:hypothetical protein